MRVRYLVRCLHRFLPSHGLGVLGFGMGTRGGRGGVSVCRIGDAKLVAVLKVSTSVNNDLKAVVSNVRLETRWWSP